MKVALNVRNRALLGVALNKYEKLAKGTKANLTTLNLPTMEVQTALGRINETKERMAAAYGEGESEPNTIEVEFSPDLVTLVRDALDFMLGKYEKLEETQIELLTGTSETEETQNEVKALKQKFADQMALMP